VSLRASRRRRSAACSTRRPPLRLPAFVVGLAPVGDVRRDSRIARLSERFAAVCDERRVPFVRVDQPPAACEIWREEAAAGDDGTHPAAGGYEALARLVLEGGWLGWILLARCLSCSCPGLQSRRIPERRDRGVARSS
jgi:hypothetical protein